MQFQNGKSLTVVVGHRFECKRNLEKFRNRYFSATFTSRRETGPPPLRIHDFLTNWPLLFRIHSLMRILRICEKRGVFSRERNTTEAGFDEEVLNSFHTREYGQSHRFRSQNTSTYALLALWRNLTFSGKQALKLSLKASERLYTA